MGGWGQNCQAITFSIQSDCSTLSGLTINQNSAASAPPLIASSTTSAGICHVKKRPAPPRRIAAAHPRPRARLKPRTKNLRSLVLRARNIDRQIGINSIGSKMYVRKAKTTHGNIRLLPSGKSVPSAAKYGTKNTMGSQGTTINPIATRLLDVAFPKTIINRPCIQPVFRRLWRPLPKSSHILKLLLIVVGCCQ
jgi:hypothetical protein